MKARSTDAVAQVRSVFVPKQLSLVVSSTNLIHVYCFQAMGYFLAFKTKKDAPPLVIVLTEEGATVLLFPFVTSDRENLFTGLQLKTLQLWDEDGLELNTQCLSFITHQVKCSINGMMMRAK